MQGCVNHIMMNCTALLKNCKNMFPLECMDLDHVRGSKIESISQMILRPYSVASVKEEILKCEPVCSNCHRIRTVWRKRNGGK